MIATDRNSEPKELEMTFAIQTGPDFELLRSRLCAPVVVPGQPGWDSARQAWNLAVDQQPAAVAYATSGEDVIAIVDFARDHGLHVAAQGTGHGASTLSLKDTILLKTLRMTGVEIDAEHRIARVQAGTLWGELAVSAGQHGLAGLAGSSTDVGVVGYTLGGGIGWLARRYGLACNSVRAIELVTAAGGHFRVDRDHEPELFWALRGGGGSFGIVTALELDLHPVNEVFAGVLAWPAGAAGDVLDTYRKWTGGLPNTLSSIFRLLNAPPLPSVPEPIRGRPVVTIDFACLGSREEGTALLRPLRSLPGLLLEALQLMPASQLTHLHGDPEQPVPGIGDGFLIGELTAEAADAFLSVGGEGSESPLVSLEVRHLGAALATASADGGALASLDGEFALYGVGSPIDEDSGRAIRASLAAVADAMEPHRSAHAYLNFADLRADPGDAFDAATYARLREVKAAYDPDDLFRSNHPVPSSS
jgi:FAD/FMN-containing dehydrogenase